MRRCASRVAMRRISCTDQRIKALDSPAPRWRRIFFRTAVGAVTDRRQHGEGQHYQRDVAVPAMPGSGLVMIEAEFGLRRLKGILNGLITNDKFCLTRAGRLRLSWPRARVRSLAPAYSSGDVIHRGGEYAAAAHLARPAHRRSDGDRPAALGSGLPAPPAMGDDESIRAG